MCITHMRNGYRTGMLTLCGRAAFGNGCGRRTAFVATRLVRAGSGGAGTRLMKLAQGACDIAHEIIERGAQGLMAGDQHIIMPGMCSLGQDMLYSLTQTAADAIAHHRVANFFRDGEADTNGAGITPIPPLHETTADTRPSRFRGSEKIPAFTKAIQGRRNSGEDVPWRADPVQAGSVACPCQADRR